MRQGRGFERGRAAAHGTAEHRRAAAVRTDRLKSARAMGATTNTPHKAPTGGVELREIACRGTHRANCKRTRELSSMWIS